MVFGDNVRARRAARALPRTPTSKEEEEERQRREETKKANNETAHPTALPHNTNHHRYSTKTPPCHKNTTLNQQCCDNEHKDGREKERNTTFTIRPHTPHTPPSRSPHTTQQHSNTKKKRAARHEGIQCKRDWTTRGARSNSKTGNIVKRIGTTRDRASQHTPPRHSIGPQGKRQEGRQHTDGGRQHSTGSPATLPPFTHHATHHPAHTPPFCDGPTHHP